MNKYKIISSVFLTEPLPENWMTLEREEREQFIVENICSLYEDMPPYAILDTIEELHDMMEEQYVC